MNYNNLKDNINYRNNSSLENGTKKENTGEINELAVNLLKGDLSINQNSMNTKEVMNYYNKREKNNDLGSLMIYNNKNIIHNNIYKNSKKNYPHEYDFDNIRGNKGIMNLEYYFNLLKQNNF